MPRAPYWTAEQTTELRQLLKEGYTYRQISKALNVSKNALIGRVHRLKIPYPAGEKARAQRAAAQKGKTIRSKPERYIGPKKDIAAFLELMRTRQHVPVDWTKEPPSLHISFVELEDGQCKYVHGDPKKGNHHFCGHPQQDLGPYCPFHTSVCLIKPPKVKARNVRHMAKTIRV